MKLGNFSIIIFTLLVHFQSFGQDTKSLYKDYAYGKELFSTNKYEQALLVFNKIAEQNDTLNFQPHALYLAAQSAYYLGKKDDALKLNNQILSKYETWNQVEEVKYLNTIMLFETKKFTTAQEQVFSIRNTILLEKLLPIRNELANKFTLDELIDYHQQHIQDKVISEVLLSKLSSSSVYFLKHKELIQSLQKHHPEHKDIKDKYPNATFKDQYHVAVLLPFLEKNFDTLSSKIATQPFVDIYQGIKTGVKVLDSLGIKIVLHTFDTEKNGGKTAQILKSLDPKKFDLIIGPLYPEPTKIAQAFSEKHKIPLVNPLSTNPEIINQKHFSFLIFPDINTQGRIAADYAIDILHADSTKIIYGPFSKDIELAMAYKKRFEERGKKVALFYPFQNEEGEFKNLLNTLDTTLQSDTLTSVFISTKNKVTASNVLSALQTQRNPSPIITTEDWLEFGQITFQQLEQAGIYLLSPNYSPVEKTHNSINKKYIYQYKTYPSIYAHAGIETILYFGKLLNNYGSNILIGIHEEPFTKGQIFTGVYFGNNNSNQITPILKFIDGRLSVMNQTDDFNTRKKLEIEKE